MRIALQQELGGLDPQIDAGERLDEAVVEIAGDAGTLLEHRHLLGLGLEPRALEAGRGLADQDEEELEVVARELASGLADHDGAAAQLVPDQDRGGQQRLSHHP